MLLNHKIIGEGEPLVILHGLFGSLDFILRFMVVSIGILLFTDIG